MSADEWADQNYAPTPYLVHAERHEAHELLHELPDLIGHTPAPLLDLKPAGVGLSSVPSWFVWLSLGDLWWLGGSDSSELPPGRASDLVRIDMLTAMQLLLAHPDLRESCRDRA